MNWKSLLQPSPILCKQSGNLYLKDSAISGKGVFATTPFYPGDLIETCPLLLIEGREVGPVRNTVLYWYYFVLGGNYPRLALALGYGSVYNHACPANASFQLEARKRLLHIYAHQTIEAGTEITLNYNGHPNDPSPVSFAPYGTLHS